MTANAWASELLTTVREYLALDAEWRGIKQLTFHPGHVDAVRNWKRNGVQRARLAELRERMRHLTRKE